MVFIKNTMVLVFHHNRKYWSLVYQNHTTLLEYHSQSLID